MVDMDLATIFWYFSTCLSIVSTLSVLLTLIIFRVFHPKAPSYEIHPTRNYYAMLFWLSMTSFVSSLFSFIASFQNWCFTQGLVSHICDLSISFWYFMMAFELYLIIVHQDQRTIEILHRRWCFFRGGNWGLAILFPMIAYFIHEGKLYRKEDDLEWCFISSNYTITIIMVYYVPQILAWIGCGIYIFKILKYTKIMTPDLHIVAPENEEEGEEQQRRKRSESSLVRKNALLATQKRLVLYPSCFLILFLTALIDRIYQWSTGETQRILVLIHILCFPAQGVVNACLFFSFSYHRSIKIWSPFFWKFKSLCWSPCRYGYWCCFSIEDFPESYTQTSSSVQLVASSTTCTPLLIEKSIHDSKNNHYSDSRSDQKDLEKQAISMDTTKNTVTPQLPNNTRIDLIGDSH